MSAAGVYQHNAPYHCRMRKMMHGKTVYIRNSIYFSCNAVPAFSENAASEAASYIAAPSQNTFPIRYFAAYLHYFAVI